MSEARSAFRVLHRAARATFGGDARARAAASAELRRRFAEPVRGEEQRRERLAGAHEAAAFLRGAVVQGVQNDRGNFAVTVEPEHTGAAAPGGARRGAVHHRAGSRCTQNDVIVALATGRPEGGESPRVAPRVPGWRPSLASAPSAAWCILGFGASGRRRCRSGMLPISLAGASGRAALEDVAGACQAQRATCPGQVPLCADLASLPRAAPARSLALALRRAAGRCDAAHAAGGATRRGQGGGRREARRGVPIARRSRRRRRGQIRARGGVSAAVQRAAQHDACCLGHAMVS